MESNNKRIAKNTLYLYFRMMIMMLVSLYTSRVLLNTLGIEDYGINNVVGGLVSMFSLISGSMSTTISRFLTYELGRNEKGKLNRIFSTSVNLQIIVAIIIVVLAETIGLWFLNCKMVIPPDRIIAANWVYQFSLVAFCINIISIPYNAVIVAHEEMSVYAYFSILEVILKLLIVFVLLVSPIDTLIFYSSLLLVTSALMRYLYSWYCKKHFEESHYVFCFDKGIIKSMGSFAGWNYLGASASILRTQGLNVLLNIFFGVTVNAARGVATQVETAVTQFVNNFTIALNPQITKTYAKGDMEKTYKLICYGAKYAFFMMLVLIVPIIIEAPTILKLWLKIVPDYAVTFLRLTLVVSLFDTLSSTLSMAMQATGKIKKFQLCVSSVVLTILPISYVLYYLGLPPYCCYIVCALIMIIKIFISLPLLKDLIGLLPSYYLKVVVIKIIPVTVLSFCPPMLLNYFLPNNVFSTFIIIILAVLSTSLFVLLIGINNNERKQFLSKAIEIKNKILPQ